MQLQYILVLALVGITSIPMVSALSEQIQGHSSKLAVEISGGQKTAQDSDCAASRDPDLRYDLRVQRYRHRVTGRFARVDC